MKTKSLLLVLLCIGILGCEDKTNMTDKKVSAADAVKVTADNYVRAESDVQMKGYAEAMDAFGKFAVNRTHYAVDNQVTVR